MSSRALLTLLAACLLPCIAHAELRVHTIQLRDGHFVVDGKPTFIRAVGYAPWRPHQWPNPPESPQTADVIDADMRRIHEAGFNTIRTWAALSRRDLDIAAKYDLMVIYGVWLNPDQEYSDPISQGGALRQIRGEIEIAKGAPNVIMYMIMTEMKPSVALPDRVASTEAFFRQIVKEIKTIDPKPVSMDSWLPLAFLDHSMWDVVAFNTFEFAPEVITQAVTFEGYNDWLRRHVAGNKPYFVGETGGYSVSPSSAGPHGGSGGHSEKEQSRLNLNALRAVKASGAIGWTLVSWIDTWHYPGPPDTHNPHEPWEWDGIVGFPNEKDPIGTPREIFRDLTPFNAEVGKESFGQPTFSDRASLRITADKPYPVGSPIMLTIQVMDTQGLPLKNQKVRVAFFVPEPWTELLREGVTSADGQLTMRSPLTLVRPDQVLIVAAGTRDKRDAYLGGEIAFFRPAP